MPSRYEGMPLAVVEAMLCGRVCIVTDVGGNRELITDNINGFIARYPYPEFLDEAMERAWQMKDNWQKIGEKASDDIRKIIPPDPVGQFTASLKEILNDL
jgi:glycosyltransferase involved in cell wall biosynthesis